MQHLRRKFIDALKFNPLGRKQIECALTDCKDGRCAMGLGLESLGINLGDGFRDEAYNEGAEALGFQGYPNDGKHFDLVWRLNDSGKTFAEIAEILEKEWED